MFSSGIWSNEVFQFSTVSLPLIELTQQSNLHFPHCQPQPQYKIEPWWSRCCEEIHTFKDYILPAYPSNPAKSTTKESITILYTWSSNMSSEQYSELKDNEEIIIVLTAHFQFNDGGVAMTWAGKQNRFLFVSSCKTTCHSYSLTVSTCHCQSR